MNFLIHFHIVSLESIIEISFLLSSQIEKIYMLNKLNIIEQRHLYALPDSNLLKNSLTRLIFNTI